MSFSHIASANEGGKEVRFPPRAAQLSPARAQTREHPPQGGRDALSPLYPVTQILPINHKVSTVITLTVIGKKMLADNLTPLTSRSHELRN